jgi:hypothetical protein
LAKLLTPDEISEVTKANAQRRREEEETGPVYVLVGSGIILLVTEWTHGSYKGFTLKERYASMSECRDLDELVDEGERLLEQPTSADIARMLANGKLRMVAQLSSDEKSLEPLTEPIAV